MSISELKGFEMRSSINILQIAGLSLILFACDSIVNENRLSETGLEGTIFKGPMCPVEREDQPCPDQPFAALFHVFDAKAIKVATFESDTNGVFRVKLNPGQFIIIPDETATIIHPTSQSKNVKIEEVGFTEITLNFDTGIR